ncbi:MAG: aminopeptidase C [Muribaculaceae bacterium]
MNKYIIAVLALGVALGAVAEDEKTDSVKGFQFTDVKTVKTTSVKDQNRSGTCWSFSGTSFFEDEVMRQSGDSLDLSEMFSVRHCYDEKARRYVRNYGSVNFTPGGQIHDVAYVIEKYGAVPEEVYAGLNYGEKKHDHSELQAGLEAYLAAVAKKPGKKLTTAWTKAVDAILDSYLGALPEEFTYKGKTYTPQSFAKSIGLNIPDYVSLSSFTHHPFYEEFALEIPDNWLNKTVINVPMEEMKAAVDNAVEHGFPVAWAADVSEPGFKWYDGVALLPVEKQEADLSGTELSRWVTLSDKDRAAENYNFDSGKVDEVAVTQEMRQEMYDNQTTTDDHGMEIVGIATDQNGKRYYKVKNSWDRNQKYGGFIYVSEPYFLAKTINVYMHRDALPKSLAKKIGK